jgi:hypothetical protein
MDRTDLNSGNVYTEIRRYERYIVVGQGIGGGLLNVSELYGT